MLVVASVLLYLLFVQSRALPSPTIREAVPQEDEDQYSYADVQIENQPSGRPRLDTVSTIDDVYSYIPSSQGATEPQNVLDAPDDGTGEQTLIDNLLYQSSESIPVTDVSGESPEASVDPTYQASATYTEEGKIPQASRSRSGSLSAEADPIYDVPIAQARKVKLLPPSGKEDDDSDDETLIDNSLYQSSQSVPSADVSGESPKDKSWDPTYQASATYAESGTVAQLPLGGNDDYDDPDDETLIDNSLYEPSTIQVSFKQFF
ncbi:hypothetical protein RF11_15074 [Thelohanellus kitauei]|uniref:Uncharacterized protein n=1 Tax=Thelohanellus kitauei TaxID=669202 RepID=A0A0C2MER4_THEKT|nr:hypothetical protein RF11_15074 [Thelohanellus kitauei]